MDLRGIFKLFDFTRTGLGLDICIITEKSGCYELKPNLNI